MSKHSKTVISERLRHASSLSDKVIWTGLFTLLAQWSLGYNDDIKGSFNPSNMVGSLADIARLSYLFFLKEWAGIILALALYFWFCRYLTHTNRELEILERLFPEERPPADWDKVTNKRIIPFLAVAIVMVFILLASLLKHPSLFALIMIILSCQDIFANEILRDNLSRVFSAYSYRLPEGDLRCGFFAAKQQAAEHYWLVRPQLLRIVLMMSTTVLILAITQLPISFPAQFTAFGVTGSIIDTAASLGLAAVILSNELTMARWRKHRDQLMRTAQKTLDEALSARTTTEVAARAIAEEFHPGGIETPAPALGRG